MKERQFRAEPVILAALALGALAVAVALVVSRPDDESSATPPVSWTTPKDGATVWGRLNESARNCIVATTTGSGVDQVRFYLDGTLLNTERSAPYSCIWDTSSAAQGSSHTLKAVVYDKSGKRSSASIGVTVRKGGSGGAGGTGAVVPHTGGVSKQDLATDSNVLGLWHLLNPGPPSRVEYHAAGGDTHPLIDGTTNDSWRRVNIDDGDRGATDPSSVERMQMGRPYVTSDSETFKAYQEGERWITYWSMRIQPIADAGGFLQVWEMYQQGGGGPPVLSFNQGNNNRLGLWAKPSPDQEMVELWGARVPTNTWLRFAVDIRYTTDANNARIQLWGDPDGGNLSLKKLTPLISGYPTLFTSSSALIAGIYQDSSVPAHHVDFANWQVAEWAP